MALNTEQIKGLDALNAKIAGGYKANAADTANLTYAAKQGYVYKPTSVPAGMTQLPSGANPADYNIKGQVGATGAPGSFLYGIKVPDRITTDQMKDSSDMLNQVKAENQRLIAERNQIPQYDTEAVTQQLNDFMAKYQGMNTSPELEAAITSRTTAGTDLANKRKEVRNFDLDTQRQTTDIEYNPNLISRQAGRNINQLERERSFSRQALSADEANLIDLYNIANDNIKTIQENIKTGKTDALEMYKLQQGVQDSIFKQKQYVYEQSRELQQEQRDIFETIVENLAGTDPDKMTANQTAELVKLAQTAGIPFELITAGLKTKYQESELKKSLDVDTQVVTAGGRSLLINTTTGETIKDLGGAYKNSGGGSGNSGGGYTPQELRKLRANGIDPKNIKKADDFLYGKDEPSENVDYYINQYQAGNPKIMNDDGSVNFSAVPEKLRDEFFKRLEEVEALEDNADDFEVTAGDVVKEAGTIVKNIAKKGYNKFLDLF